MMEQTGHSMRVHLAWLAALAVIGIACWLLIKPPFIGVADNGDFSRLMRLAGFRYLDPHETYADRYFAYAHQHFGYMSYGKATYFTTQVILLAAIGWVARLANSEVFDIRWFGVVYSIGLAFIVYLVVRHAPQISGRKLATATFAVGTGILLLFVFCDIGYLAYFQSFFGEPYALLGMLLAVAAAFAISQTDKPTGRMLLIYIVAALALATSKIQHAPLGLIFALLAWRMIDLRQDRRWRRFVWTGAGALLTASILMMAAVPSGFRHINLYQSIFFGVLKDSPHLSRDMKELGIPEKYAVNAGTNYFQKHTAIPQDDPTLRKEVLDRLGHQDIAAYYLRHPARFVNKLEQAAAKGAFIRPYYLGNYDQSAGKPRGAVTDAYELWSDWKAHRMPHTLGWFGGWFLLYFAGLIMYWLRAATRRGRFAAEMLTAVGVSGLISFVVPIIGDGEADLYKHLFMFNVCFDMMVVSAIMALLYGLLRTIVRRRVK